MKTKDRKTIFVCQFGENNLKVARCQSENSRNMQASQLLACEPIPAGADDKKIVEITADILKKMGFLNQTVVISLPRYQATCRYLKIPSQNTAETEKIISLQASRYLPYPANELISGFQALHTDKDGFTHLNATIVHRNVVQKYLKIFAGLNTKNIKVGLSSYSLCSLPLKNKNLSNIILDIDVDRVEAAFVMAEKMYFSRSFRLSSNNWQNTFTEEFQKTLEAYRKEVAGQEPERIIVASSAKNTQEFLALLPKISDMPVEPLSYDKDIALGDISFAGLIGFGIKDFPDTLNLLPKEIKDETTKAVQLKRHLKAAALISAILLIFGLGMAKSLDNKKIYLDKLKRGLQKIEKEAKPLAELDNRFVILEKRLKKKPTSVDVLYEFTQIMPQGITLSSLDYEEGNQVVLSGKAGELNSVFIFVSALEKSQVFKQFSIKVRYATKKRTATGEGVEYQIACTKK